MKTGMIFMPLRTFLVFIAIAIPVHSQTISINGLTFPATPNEIIRTLGAPDTITTSDYSHSCFSDSSTTEDSFYYYRESQFEKFYDPEDKKSEIMPNTIVLAQFPSWKVIWDGITLTHKMSYASVLKLLPAKPYNHKSGRWIFFMYKDFDNGIMFNFKRGKLNSIQYWCDD
jgi:hypothetical protein